MVSDIKTCASFEWQSYIGLWLMTGWACSLGLKALCMKCGLKLDTVIRPVPWALSVSPGARGHSGGAMFADIKGETRFTLPVDLGSGIMSWYQLANTSAAHGAGYHVYRFRRACVLSRRRVTPRAGM